MLQVASDTQSTLKGITRGGQSISSPQAEGIPGELFGTKERIHLFLFRKILTYNFVSFFRYFIFYTALIPIQ